MQSGGVFSAEIVSDLPGIVTIRIAGNGAKKAFKPEAGGHRWQRIPPTEKRGRTQTSSVTVAIISDGKAGEVEWSDKDLRIDTYVGSGPGGQHRNKVATAVRITHLPTGTVVCCENERSQGQNKRFALEQLSTKLAEAEEERHRSKTNSARRGQIGTGYRGDKIRTVQMQNDRVTNHVNGRKCSAKQYLKGNLGLIQ